MINMFDCTFLSDKNPMMPMRSIFKAFASIKAQINPGLVAPDYNDLQQPVIFMESYFTTQSRSAASDQLRLADSQQQHPQSKSVETYNGLKQKNSTSSSETYDNVKQMSQSPQILTTASMLTYHEGQQHSESLKRISLLEDEQQGSSNSSTPVIGRSRAASLAVPIHLSQLSHSYVPI